MGIGVGYILLAVGAFGILISMIFWSSWAAPATGRNGAEVRRRGPASELLEATPRRPSGPSAAAELS